MLDVGAIRGLSTGGREVHTDPDFPSNDLEYTHDPTFHNLLTWNYKTSGVVTDVEHNAFLIYFFNKFFYSTNSFEVTKELHPFIRMLLSDQGYSRGPFFLPHIYIGMNNLLRQVRDNVHYPKAEGPIWFMQLWVQLYFPNFSSTDPF